jgi:hypothetical protein
VNKPRKVWGYDPKERLTELIAELMSVPGPSRIADVELNGENIEDLVAAAKAAAKEADDLNIASGKEDLASYAVTLCRALDAIRDDHDRHNAYDALYHVVNGTFLIAKSGIDPLNEQQRSQDKQAAVMRARRERELAERDLIVCSLITELEKKEGKRLPAKRLLDLVNNAIAGPKIKIGVLYGILKKRRLKD